MKKIYILIILIASSSFAQLSKEVAPFQVSKQGKNLTYPFLGGFNNPKPTLIDINNDNLIDLLIGNDRSGKIMFLENQGTLESPNWVVNTEQFASIDIGTWYTFSDIDADGDFDLFCDSRTGKVYFYQNNSIGNNFQFTLIDTAFGDFLAGNNNTPTFCDIDNDNDLDFFYGNTTGYLSFYENIGDSANPIFTLIDNAYDSIYAYPSGLISSSVNDVNHGFSNIQFADIDNDNDYDLFWGDIFNQNMYLFINNGTPEVSDLIWQTQDYLPEITQGFNHPTFADIDNDTDLDLVIGVAQNADIENLLLYRNNGSPENSLFALEETDFIDNIDLGSTTIPITADMDFDNDLDIIIGNVSGELTYYENVGNRFSPEYRFVTDNYGGIDVGFSSAPFVVDYDTDGDLDMLVGNQSGKVEYWRNDGTKQIFQPTLVTNQLAGIKRDQLVSPQMIDLNDDGLKDLVIGEWDFNSKANVLLYQNIGTIFNPVFVIIDSTLLNPLDSNMSQVIREYTRPFFYDYDKDSIPDLILSRNSSGIDFYKNVSPKNIFPTQATLLLQSDTLHGSNDGVRLSPFYVDIDFDNDVDLLIGEGDGGINFYEYSGNCCQGFRGNIDLSVDGLVTIADIVLMVDVMFKRTSISTYPCEEEADLYDDTYIDISDLVYLVEYYSGNTGLSVPCQ